MMRVSAVCINRVLLSVTLPVSGDSNGRLSDVCALFLVAPSQVLPRLCNIKIPAASREGEPFEETLQAWLQLMWCPTFKQLLCDKKRGIGSKTL